MTQFAVDFWHLKNLPFFKNCGQPVKREQYFGIWTENLTCQLDCPERIVSETRGSTCNKDRLCTVGRVLMSTSAPRSGESSQLGLFPFSPTSFPQPLNTLTVHGCDPSSPIVQLLYVINTMTMESYSLHTHSGSEWHSSTYLNHPSPAILHSAVNLTKKVSEN